MSITVKWDASFPADLRVVVEPLIRDHLHYLPSWVAEVPVFWVDGMECPAQARVQEEYRWIAIDIGPSFFSGQDRAHMILHEFCHAYTIPPTKVAKECIRNFCPEETAPGLRIAEDVITQRMEAATEDLTLMLERIRA